MIDTHIIRLPDGTYDQLLEHAGANTMLNTQLFPSGSVTVDDRLTLTSNDGREHGGTVIGIAAIVSLDDDNPA